MVEKMEKEGMGDIDLLRTLQDDASPESIDSLWHQLMVFKAFAENDLSTARARRSDAEHTQKVVEAQTSEAAAATKPTTT